MTPRKLFTLLLIGLTASAQAQVPDWANAAKRNELYPTAQYITGYSMSNIQSNESLDKATQRITNTAKVNAISTISVRIQNTNTDLMENIQLKSESGNHMAMSRTNTSVTSSKVDMEISGMKFETYHDATNNRVMALAHIKISDLIRQTDRRITTTLAKIETGLEEMEEMISYGEKSKAREKGEKMESLFWDLENQQKILLAVDPNADAESIQLEQSKALQSKYIKMMAELKNGINICLKCSAQMIDAAYPVLQNEIKGALSTLGCSFVADADKADWIITVDASARPYNTTQYGSISTYFTFVDATISITKGATGQVVYTDQLSVKGGHSHNYTEAARTAYKEISPEISTKIKNEISK